MMAFLPSGNQTGENFPRPAFLDPMTSPASTAEPVCAVVVTYNRLTMLQQCIENLKRQTRPPETILVVNNGSTDDTAAWLAGRGDLITLTQANLGSAGGFFTGIRHAHEAGFAWIWLMDDDLVVPPEALGVLLEDARRGGVDLLNPLVAADTEPEVLTFGLTPEIQTVAAAKSAARDGLIPDVANPFNGLLVSRRAVDRIGFVKPEMFISGDEIEYIHRALANGLKVATSTGVTCHHPKPRFAYRSILFNRFRVELPDGQRRWIFLRNLGYINARYRGVFALARDAFKYCWFFLVHERSSAAGGCGRFLSYYFDGIRDRYALPPTREAVPMPTLTPGVGGGKAA